MSNGGSRDEISARYQRAIKLLSMIAGVATLALMVELGMIVFSFSSCRRRQHTHKTQTCVSPFCTWPALTSAACRCPLDHQQAPTIVLASFANATRSLDEVEACASRTQARTWRRHSFRLDMSTDLIPERQAAVKSAAPEPLENGRQRCHKRLSKGRRYIRMATG